MAVMQTGSTGAGNTKDFVGLSTDTKPVDCGAGSTFWELDLKQAFLFDGISQWYEV